MKRLHPVRGRRHHTLDLMVFPFGEGHADVAFVHEFHVLGAHGFGRIVEHDARAELFAKDVRRRMLERHLVNLGDMALRMNEPVQKTTVVGKEQNARRINVQASDGLYAAATQGAGRSVMTEGCAEGLSEHS